MGRGERDTLALCSFQMHTSPLSISYFINHQRYRRVGSASYRSRIQAAIRPSKKWKRFDWLSDRQERGKVL
jgi:hypothetical protein